MTIDTDPFFHLPDLRPRISEPSRSRYRSVDLGAMDRKMREAGFPPSWRRTDQEREANRAAVLQTLRHRDLWVFAYGSLMWDPGLHFCEVRMAALTGFHRQFCLRSRLGRGSFDNPGLMAALHVGGTCNGLAFRIQRDMIEAETRILWSREMVMLAYDPRLVEVETPQGKVEALAFVINPASENYVGALPLREAAAMIATAHGLYGSNLDYLDNLAVHLNQLNIRDDAFFQLYDCARRLAGQSV